MTGGFLYIYTEGTYYYYFLIEKSLQQPKIHIIAIKY